MTMRTTLAARGLAICAIGLALGAGLGTAFAPSRALAQSMPEILRRTGLSQQDINIMSQAAAPLYRSGTPKVGSSADWSNPDTGASGTATLTAFANRCADIRHVVITTRRPEPQPFVMRNCQNADGAWTLSP
ncbi:MAG: hypothetical protein CML68_25080 [Rhodobacteraceae bacterium]|nr:hypothetical protein [Paracoccaceae bacterium]